MLNRLDTYATTCCEDDRDKCEFIKLCLHPDANRRPDAKSLSRHEALFTLSQLRILAAHAVHEYRDIYSREGKYSLDEFLDEVTAYKASRPVALQFKPNRSNLCE